MHHLEYLYSCLAPIFKGLSHRMRRRNKAASVRMRLWSKEGKTRCSLGALLWASRYPTEWWTSRSSSCPRTGKCLWAQQMPHGATGFCCGPVFALNLLQSCLHFSLLLFPLEKPVLSRLHFPCFYSHLYKFVSVDKNNLASLKGKKKRNLSCILSKIFAGSLNWYLSWSSMKLILTWMILNFGYFNDFIYKKYFNLGNIKEYNL